MKLSVIRLLAAMFFVSLLVFPIPAQQQSAPEPISSYGVIEESQELTWLHTDGKYIKNEAGQIVSLIGVAVIELNSERTPFGVSKYWGQEDGSYREDYGYLPNSFDLLQSSGVTAVRLAINWFSWMGIDDPLNPIAPEEATRYKEAVDMFVQELYNRGIYSYIDVHTLGVLEPADWQYFVDNRLDQYWSFWQEVAQRYMNISGMMGGQLINEPRDHFNTYPYDGYWWDFVLEVAQKIHAVNSNLLVFIASTDRYIDGAPLGYAESDAGYKVVGDQFVNNPLPEPNIVYVFHQHFPMVSDIDFYQNYVAGNLDLAKQQFEDFLYKIAFRALDAGLPIMNTEFNIKHYDYKTREELPYPYLTVARDYLELMNKYGCHWNWWPWKGSVGYPWDHSPGSNTLVYMSDPDLTVWNKLSYIGEVWKDNLKA